MQMIYQSIVTLLEMHRRHTIDDQEAFVASRGDCLDTFYIDKLESLEVLGLVQRTGDRFSLTKVGIIVAENMVRVSLESVLGGVR